MSLSAPTRFRDLVTAKLAGRKIDLVGFVDALLDLVREIGELHCALASDNAWQVTSGADTGEVALPAARAKLRMVCARLSLLCKEAPNDADFPYGGTGMIAAAGTPAARWQLVFKNTPEAHEFAVAHWGSPPGASPRQPQANDRPAPVQTAEWPGRS